MAVSIDEIEVSRINREPLGVMMLTDVDDVRKEGN